MRSLQLKTLFGGLVLLVAMLACSVISPATLNAPAATDTVSAVTATPTPAILAIPPLPSPAIQSLDMLDIHNGWALTDSAVVRTTDGGTTWHNVSPEGLNAAPANPFFLDTDNAWLSVMGADPTGGTLYHTTDGGLTWNSVAVPFGGGSFHFTDALHGWEMVGLSGGMSHEAVAIFSTSDGGTTWSKVFTDDPGAAGSSDSLPLVGDKNGITALDSTHAWVTGAQPSDNFIYIYMSQDGGTTWAHQDTALPDGFGGGMTNVSLPVFFGANEAVLPVELFANSNATDFYVSQDGGQTWNATKPVNQGGFTAASSASDFFVWDGGSKLKVSHDGGATWSNVTPNINIQDKMVSMQFVNASTGWVLTDDASGHRTLYGTSDGGASWTPLIP